MPLNETISKYVYRKLERNNFNNVIKIKTDMNVMQIIEDLRDMIELGNIPFHEFDYDKDAYFFPVSNTEYMFFLRDENIATIIRLCFRENCSIEKVDFYS